MQPALSIGERNLIANAKNKQKLIELQQKANERIPVIGNTDRRTDFERQRDAKAREYNDAVNSMNERAAYTGSAMGANYNMTPYEIG